jgi:plasmid stabilization system protein ParE
MTATVLYKPAAQVEISDIAEYLEGQRPGFGRLFIDEIGRVEDFLRDNPELYALVDGPIRRAVLRRFPYGLFYIVENSQVLVLACFHLHRGPRSYLDLVRR